MGGTAADYLVSRLHAWGVRRVYGYPGDGVNGVTAALRRQDDIRFILARHEELASLMACAHAKFTGEVGVCISTAGPGAIQLLNGLYDAKLDHQPVVAIVGQQPSYAMGGDFLQEVDLVSMFKDVAGEYVHQASSAIQIRQLIDRAMRIAIANRTVTCVIVPGDIQEEDAVPSPPSRRGATYTGIGYSRPRLIPTEDDLQRAAGILNESERPAMLVGAGALGAQQAVADVADALGAGVAKALLGKAVLPDDLPYVTGAIGLLGTRPSWQMMKQCDALLMVGSTFPYTQFLPREGQARGVQIDTKARALSLRYPMDVCLHGDARLTLEALLPLLKPTKNTTWRDEIAKDVADWWQLLEDRAHNEADPINPQRVFWELSSRLPDDCILAADSGSVCNWWARDLKIRQGMMASVSGKLATMGCGVPYAVAAKFAFPERVAIATVGDGAMQMIGINSLITVAERWKEWSDPRLICCVLNNSDLNQVTWEQRVLLGDVKFADSQNLPAFNYAQYADQLGLRGIRVESPDEIGPAWDAALAADRPVLLDVVTDPNVPPLPPHNSFENAVNYLKSMLKGDPDTVGTVKQSVADMLAAWLPGVGRRISQQ